MKSVNDDDIAGSLWLDVSGGVIDRLQDQGRRMKRIKHEHIIGVEKVYRMPAKCRTLFIMEYVPRGELLDRVKSHGRMSEASARFYFQQLVSGVGHCHSNGLHHFGLWEAEDLLLDEKGNLKVSGFANSCLRGGDTLPGPFDAPEIVKTAKPKIANAGNLTLGALG